MIDDFEDEEPSTLDSWMGLRRGMHVRYENPAWQQPDGTFRTAGMDPPLVIDSLIEYPGVGVLASLNDGEWEVSAGNLVPDPEAPNA